MMQDGENRDVSVETAGVDVDDGNGDNANEDSPIDEPPGRSYGRMSLRKQHRKEYNVFNVNEDARAPDNSAITLLTLSDNENGFEESEFSALDAEYTFLHNTLGCGRGLKEHQEDDRCDNNANASITKLAKYLFVTEQMGWRQGLKTFGERGEKAIGKELHSKSTTWKDFNQNTGMNLPKRRGPRHLST